MEDLAIEIRNEIDAILINARNNLELGEIELAVNMATTAWAKVPEPKFGWDVSKSFVSSVARIYRNSKKFDAALTLMNELFSSGTVKKHQDGPYFLLGTIYFEMGDKLESIEWLSQANEISKGRCFREQDPKYLKFFLENKKDK